MIFEYLYFKDFMKIKETEFHLADNAMPILSGGNGQGKSAVFYGMNLVLTGFKKGGTYRHYIRRGTHKFLIKAVFRIHPKDEPISAVLECSATKTIPLRKQLTHRGQTYSGSDYDAYLARLIDASLLEAITFSLQGEATLASYKPFQLRDLLKTVFQTSFTREQDALGVVVSSMRETLRELEEQRIKLSAQLDTLNTNTEMPARPPSKSQLEDTRTRIQELRHERDALRQATIAVDRARIDMDSAIYEAKRVSQERDVKQKAHDQLQNAHTKHLETIDTLRVRLAEDQANEVELSTSDVDIANVRKAEIECDQSIRTIQERLAIVDKGQCPTCSREAPVEWVSNRDALAQQLKEVVSSREVQKQQLEKLEERVKELRHTQSSISSLKTSLEHMLQQSAENEKRLKELDEQLHAPALAEKVSVAKDKEREKIAAFKKAEESCRDSVLALEEIEREIATTETQLHQLQHQQSAYITYREMLHRNGKAIEKTKAELEHANSKLHSVKVQITPHEVAERIVDKYLPSFGVLVAGQKVIEQMLHIIHPVMPAWDIRLVTARDGVAFEYREGTESDEWSPIAMASGFELAMCSLAFKMTLTAVYGLPLMILDEVDAAAVEANSYRVFDSISQFKREFNIHQIWLVSHRREVVEQLIREYGDTIQHYAVADGEFELEWRASH